MIFWLSYFNFWPDFITMILSLIPFYVNRMAINGNSAVESIVFICYIPWHIMNLFIIHWVFSTVFMLYCEAEVLRNGND